MDDAILSLGASIACATRAGATVEVLTAFAGDAESALPAGGWDRRAGFETEGEATRARRAEDRRACGVVGARSLWLPYPDEQYLRQGERSGELALRVVDELRGADAVLLPGGPLTHRDHAWLSGVLLETTLPVARLGFYLEQPYAVWQALDPSRPDSDWLVLRPDRAARARKARAIRCYASQWPLLGLSRLSGLPLLSHHARGRVDWPEAIRWAA